MAHVLERTELLLGPPPAAERLESAPKPARELPEISRVRRSVGELRGLEGAPSPIRPLIPLVQSNVQLLVEQGGQPGLLLTQQLSHDLGILEPSHPRPVVTIEDPDVVVGAVHQHRSRGVTDHLPQRCEIGWFEGEGVDDDVPVTCGDLDQTHLVEVGVHRVGLGVEGEAAGANAKVRSVLHTIRGIDPDRSKVVGHGWGW